MRRTLFFFVMASVVPALVAAQIVNGTFDSGGAGWTATGGAVFPSAGGNPGGYAADNGYPATISQVFDCGGTGNTCLIGWDFKRDGGGSETFRVSIDGNALYECVSCSGDFSWTHQTVTTTCGTHTLAIEWTDQAHAAVLVDNVTAECVLTVPVEPNSWGTIKNLFE